MTNLLFMTYVIDIQYPTIYDDKDTCIDLYIRSPFGPTIWFCNLVLTKSSGNTTDTPIIPAIPPFMIFGTSLKIESISSNVAIHSSYIELFFTQNIIIKILFTLFMRKNEIFLSSSFDNIIFYNAFKARLCNAPKPIYLNEIYLRRGQSFYKVFLQQQVFIKTKEKTYLNWSTGFGVELSCAMVIADCDPAPVEEDANEFSETFPWRYICLATYDRGWSASAESLKPPTLMPSRRCKDALKSRQNIVPNYEGCFIIQNIVHLNTFCSMLASHFAPVHFVFFFSFW